KCTVDAMLLTAFTALLRHVIVAHPLTTSAHASNQTNPMDGIRRAMVPHPSTAPATTHADHGSPHARFGATRAAKRPRARSPGSPYSASSIVGSLCVCPVGSAIHPRQ